MKGEPKRARYELLLDPSRTGRTLRRPGRAIQEEGWLRYRVGPLRWLKNATLWRLRGYRVLGCSDDGRFAIELRRHRGRRELVWRHVGVKHMFGPELDTEYEYVFPYSCYSGPVGPGEDTAALDAAGDILAQPEDFDHPGHCDQKRGVADG